MLATPVTVQEVREARADTVDASDNLIMDRGSALRRTIRCWRSRNRSRRRRRRTCGGLRRSAGD
jgi:hypothetical protein